MGLSHCGRGWLYDVITPELPAGFPEGAGIKQRVRVYGYFFKLQGYYPLGAKPNARPQIAPLIIGRVESVQTPVPVNPAEEMLTKIVLAGGGVILLGAIGYWVVAARRKKSARATAGSAWPAAAGRTGPEDASELTFPRPGNTASDEPDAFDWLASEKPGAPTRRQKFFIRFDAEIQSRVRTQSPRPDMTVPHDGRHSLVFCPASRVSAQWRRQGSNLHLRFRDALPVELPPQESSL